MAKRWNFVKIRWRQEDKLLACFFAGLLVGTAAANACYPSMENQVGYYIGLLDRNTGLLGETQISLFGEICRQRLIEVLVVWLIGLTVYAMPCFGFIAAGFGLSLGVIISVMTGQKGLLGLPAFVVSVLPQALCYVPVWCLLMVWGLRRNGRLRLPGFVFLLVLVTAGSACETWLNPYFLRFLL